jgi:RAB protein geranylgeranyltransferase component A
MKQNAKIVCIDNQSKYGQTKKFLTYGKIYELRYKTKLKGDIDLCVIMDDSGNVQSYPGKRFITLEEWRDNRLKELTEW